MDKNILDHFELPKDTTGNFKAKCRECSTYISWGRHIRTIFFAHNFRAKSIAKNFHFQWQRMNLTNLISDKNYDFYVKL
jgi:hypothetical protein